MEQVEPGWLRGTHQQNGKRGLIPSNYVEAATISSGSTVTKTPVPTPRQPLQPQPQPRSSADDPFGFDPFASSQTNNNPFSNFTANGPGSDAAPTGARQTPVIAVPPLQPQSSLMPRSQNGMKHQLSNGTLSQPTDLQKFRKPSVSGDAAAGIAAVSLNTQPSPPQPTTNNSANTVLSKQTSVSLFEKQQKWLQLRQQATTGQLLADKPSFMIDAEYERFSQAFDEAISSSGRDKLPGQVGRSIFMMSLLSNEKLRRVWRLCDVDRDGELTRREFLLGCWLIVWMLRKDREYPPSVLTRNQIEWVRFKPPSAAPADSSKPTNITTQAKGTGNSLLPNGNSKPPLTVPRNSGAPNATASQRQPPNEMDIMQYSMGTEQGRQTTTAAVEFSQTSTGKAVGSAVWDNRDQIYAASQTPAGKKMTAAAWDNRDQIAKTGAANMKAASNQ